MILTYIYLNENQIQQFKSKILLILFRLEL